MNLREVREAIAAERRKLPAVDHNGRATADPPQPEPAAAPAEPARPRNPIPDPSQGARGTVELPRPEPTTLPRRQQTVARISGARDDQLADLRRRGYKGSYPGTHWHIKPDDAA